MFLGKAAIYYLRVESKFSATGVFVVVVNRLKNASKCLALALMVRYESMNFTVYVGSGILLVLVIIGLFILLRRDSLKFEHNKMIYIVIGVLQALHVILYLTGLLEKITQTNVYLAFGICAIVSVICIVVSGWMLLPFSKFKHGIKYLFMFIAMLQVISTIIIFLLPEAGIPPLVQF